MNNGDTTLARRFWACIARAAGQPVESFYRQYIFDPLGMIDTGFRTPASQLHRLAPCYLEVEGALKPFDDDDQWPRPRAFADCGAGLVSTVRDYTAFGQMLLVGGTHRGERILAPELVAAMTTDQLSPEQRDTAGPLLDGRGWGFGLSIIDRPELPGKGRHSVGQRPRRGPRRHPVHAGALVHRQLGVEPDFWSTTYPGLGS